jgi:hypothetical protein
VPYVDAWQLDCHASDTTPWRVIDRHTDPGRDGTDNIAIALQATSVAILHIELIACRQALHGISEIRQSGGSGAISVVTVGKVSRGECGGVTVRSQRGRAFAA